MQELYDFQVEGVTKLAQVPAGLNGDDMGLGKTVQAIKVDGEKRRTFGPEFAQKGKIMTLVVCPMSMMGAWEEHFKTWAPHLKVVVLDTKARGKFTYAAAKGKGDVFVCHWASLRLMPELRKIWWFHVIADEVHRIKNRKAQQTLALKAITTPHKLGLSGTPADNAPQDFWSVLNWLYPKDFSRYQKFFDNHVLWRQHTPNGGCTAVDPNTGEMCMKYHKRSFREILGCAETEELHRAIDSFYVRRLKENVLKDLPDKYYTKHFVELAPPQRRAYDSMAKQMIAWVGKHEDDPLAASMAIAKLIRLQQFACAFGEMVLKKVVRRECEEDECVLAGTCQGHLIRQLALTDPSSKLDAAMELIEDNPGKQIGFFAQSSQIVKLLEARLEKADIPCAILTGKVKNPAVRSKIVGEFQTGKRRIFAATYGAGGEGITLTAASTCVRIDRPWSPTPDRQAVDRFHRIGQKNAVQVIDFIAQDTIDAYRGERVEVKWEWLREILGDKR